MKLTKEQIAKLEELLQRGDKQKDLALEFGVTQGRISQIKKKMNEQKEPVVNE